eukprot:400302-Pleurochrysis_carterae.AAC.1
MRTVVQQKCGHVPEAHEVAGNPVGGCAGRRPGSHQHRRCRRSAASAAEPWASAESAGSPRLPVHGQAAGLAPSPRGLPVPASKQARTQA